MKSTKSRKELRQDQILHALEANPSLRVNQLAETLDVSTETIRRDLAELDQIGRLTRTYGGAVSANGRFEPALNDRLGLYVAERQAIARAAFERFGEAEAMILSGGATMLIFARLLSQTRQRLTAITPSYAIALELASNPLIEVMLLPGIFDAQERIVHGPEAIRAIGRYRAPVTLTGASGLCEEGISEAMLNVGEFYSTMLEHASHTVILADHSKFDKRALVLLSPWSAGMTLITDRSPPPALSRAMRQANSECVVAIGSEQS